MAHTGWVIIEFHSDGSVSEVPSDWVVGGGVCYWPPYKPSRISLAIKNCELRDESWEKLAISVFPGGIYYDYATARAKARKAEETSDLQSDAEVKKRKIKPKTYSSSEESGSTALLPPPPKIGKSLIRSEEIFPNTRYGSQESSFPHNIEIEKIDAGPSGSSSNNNSNDTDDDVQQLLKKSDIIIAQNHLLRTLLLETMERVKALENNIRHPTAPLPDEKQSFFNKFNYLQFPLHTIEQLKELEEILKEQRNFQDAVNEFASFGGSDPYNFVKRVLRSVLTNDICTKYSWFGRKTKEAFAKLKLASAVIYAAEKAKVTDSKKKCEGAIMSWLKRASERQLAAEKKK